MEPGIRDEDDSVASSGALFAVGRGLGFILLAGAAMASLAAVVLLPAYAHLAQARYDLACVRADIDDAEAQITANDRLIAALPQDPVLLKRLAISQNQFWPQQEVVVVDPQAPAAPPPDVVTPPRSPRPAPPADALLLAAEKLEDPAKRRGLLLLAGGALVTAMFLYSPPDHRRKPKLGGS